MARWLKAECCHCSHIGGCLILVDRHSGGGVGRGFVIGVGSGGGWVGVVAGVGVVGGSRGYIVCGGV